MKNPPKFKKLPKKESQAEIKASSGWDPRPTLHFDSKQLPMVKDMDFDDEVTLIIKTKVTSVSKSEKGKTNISLRVEEVAKQNS